MSILTGSADARQPLDWAMIGLAGMVLLTAVVLGMFALSVGFITTALRYGTKPLDVQGMLEFLSTKLGVVLLVLGGMHFFNLFNFDKMRKKGTRPEGGPTAPPALPLR